MEEHDGGEIIRSKKLSDALKGHRSGRRTHASSMLTTLTAEFLLLRTSAIERSESLRQTQSKKAK